MDKSKILESRVAKLEAYVFKLERAISITDNKMFIRPQVKFEQTVFDRVNTKKIN